MKARERGVSGDRAQAVAADGGFERERGRARALIVPQQRRPDHRGPLVEEDGAVHLARDADAANRAIVRRGDPAQRLDGRVPPRPGILLRPPGLRRQ